MLSWTVLCEQINTHNIILLKRGVSRAEIRSAQHIAAQFTTKRPCVIAPDSLSGPIHSVTAVDMEPDGLKVTFRR